MLELVLVLALVSVLLANIVPFMIYDSTARKIGHAHEEVQSIMTGMFGSPKLGHYGYISTMGQAPDYILRATNGTVTPGSGSAACNDLTQPCGAVTTAKSEMPLGVISGWAGPYAIMHNENDFIDPWNNPYNLMGTANSFRIISLGADQTPSADDISPSISTMDINAPLNLRANLAYRNGRALRLPKNSISAMQVYFVNNGTASFTTYNASALQANWTGNHYGLNNTHYGLHPVKVTVAGLSPGVGGVGGCSGINCQASDVIFTNGGTSVNDVTINSGLSRPPMRPVLINAGATTSGTDAAGRTWAADRHYLTPSNSTATDEGVSAVSGCASLTNSTNPGNDFLYSRMRIQTRSAAGTRFYYRIPVSARYNNFNVKLHYLAPFNGTTITQFNVYIENVIVENNLSIETESGNRCTIMIRNYASINDLNNDGYITIQLRPASTTRWAAVTAIEINQPLI